MTHVPGPPILGKFVPLPDVELERLIFKGRQDARELDKNIKSQFEMSEEDAKIVLRGIVT
jgi:hypothetical protein